MPRLLPLAAAIAFALALPAWAQDASGGDYHPIEPVMWGHWGLDAATADAGLAPAMSAVAAFHIAAAPQAGAPGTAEAMARARAAYDRAAAALPGAVAWATIPHAGAAFDAIFHLPPGDGPHPVLVLSNGSDMGKEASLAFYVRALLPRGIALLSLDLPGMNGSAAFDLATTPSDALHAAAVAWVRTQPGIDPGAVFVQGVSMGGNAAARFFLTRSDLGVAGVIYVCGPMGRVLHAPPAMLAHFPAFTMDGVRARLGLPSGASLEDVSTRLGGLALDGLLDGPGLATPLLALNTTQDPIAPVDEMDRLVARATDATVRLWDEPGHCPDQVEREDVIAAWIAERAG